MNGSYDLLGRGVMPQYGKAVALMGLFLFFAICPAMAQEDTFDEDLEEYLGKSKVLGAKNVVKYSPSAMYQGDFALFYERAIRSNFSVEAGLGYQLSFYNSYRSHRWSEDNDVLSDLFLQVPFERGMSIYFHPRFYWENQAPEEGYVGVQLRRRFYEFTNGDLSHTDLTANVGWQLSFWDYFLFEYNGGIGLRNTGGSINYPGLEKTNGFSKFIVQFNVRLGVIF